MNVTGVVGKPEIARSNRSNQIFFVNKRFVKDKTLMGAAENSFKGLLPIGKYGFLILNIDMDPGEVDVNVHPAKLEVRFQEENKVFKAIYHAIKDTLLKGELIENTEKTVEDIEDVMPKKSAITDLFRKIKSQETEKQEKNVIEQIYNNREETKIEKKENKLEGINLDYKEKVLPNQDKKMDVFKELIAMQQRLKEEAQNDPNLHTNIDTLIESTQKLQEGEKNSRDNQEISDVFSNNLGNNEYSIENKKDEEQLETLKENEESYKITDEVTKEKTEISNIDEENINSLLDVNNTLQEQDTKKFTSEEVQEMMDKLETIENVEESPEFSNMYEKIFGKLPASVEEEKKKEEEKISAYELIKDNNISVFEDIPEYQKPIYKLVGIAFNTYIIIEIKNELYIIDQHAAH